MQLAFAQHLYFPYSLCLPTRDLLHHPHVLPHQPPHRLLLVPPPVIPHSHLHPLPRLHRHRHLVVRRLLPLHLYHLYPSTSPTSHLLQLLPYWVALVHHYALEHPLPLPHPSPLPHLPQASVLVLPLLPSPPLPPPPPLP